MHLYTLDQVKEGEKDGEKEGSNTTEQDNVRTHTKQCTFH